MTFLRAIATPFKPMSITHNIAKKAVTWHPRGITEVRRFTIESCESLPKRELVGPPKSTIKDADPEASNPFKIPDEDDEVLTFEERLLNLQNDNYEPPCPDTSSIEDIQLASLEERLLNLQNAVNLEHMVNNLLEEPDPHTMDWEVCDTPQPEMPVFRYTKGDMAMWCE